MDVIQITFAALAIILVIKFVFLFPLRRRMAADPQANVLARHTGYAVASALATVASMVLLSCVLVLAGLALIAWREGTRASEVEQTIMWLQSLRDRIQTIEPVLGLATLGLITIALIYVSYRQSRMRVKTAVESARASEFEALAEQATAGTLPELPPTEQMKQIGVELGKVESEMHALIEGAAKDQGVAVGGEVTLDPATARHVGELRHHCEQLSRLHAILDFERRISGRLRDADVEIPEPRTTLGKIGTFFISSGQLRSMRFLSKAVFLIGVLLIVPSLLAITTPAVADAMDDRLDRLEDVYVALQQDEALESWQNYRADAATDTAGTLDDDDVQAINQAAVALEFALAQRAAEALKLDAFVNRATLRAQGARIRLFRTYNERVDALGMKVSMRGFAEDADLSDLHRAIVEFELDAAMLPDRPSTSAGQAFAEALQEAVPAMERSRWEATKKQIRTEWGDFQRLSSRQQLRSLFVTHVMFDGVAPGVPADDAVAHLVRNLEDLVPFERRSVTLAASQAEFLEMLEADGLTSAIEHVGDANRPHPFGRHEVDDLYINVQSFAGDDGFDRELRNFSPYLDEVTDARVNRAAAEKLARTMATSSVAEGFQLVDPLASLVQFSDVRSGAGPARVARKPYTPPRRVTRVSSKPRFRFRFRR